MRELLFTIGRLRLASAAVLLTCAPTPAADIPQARPERLYLPGLPNAYRLHQRVISGGEPAGEEAFEALKQLGIRTIISVDGAQPNLALAAKYGLRYVHLPHGYDGISQQRAQELAKALRDLPGPIYIHCHHGKHRSPAAAGIACVGAGLMTPEQALAVLTTAGTSQNYRGLYQSVRSARRFDDELLDALLIEFPESAKVPPIAEAMADMERTFDHLKALADANWPGPGALAQQPDLDAAHEALMLKEHYQELLRTDDVKRQPEAFRRLLADAHETAGKLETELRRWQQAVRKGPPPASVRELFSAAASQCTTCHQQFRDVKSP